MSNSTRIEIVLNGLDGSNPLAFLAALGTLRTLSHALPTMPIKMSWQSGQHWMPMIVTETAVDQTAILDMLESQLVGKHDRPEFTTLGNDLSVTPLAFQAFAKSVATAASHSDRSSADFAAAYGCESTISASSTSETIQDTALRTMAGAGHQHFLGFMRNIIDATTRRHLDKTLFATWVYDDPVQNLTLRWDPVDDIRYALQWRNPSGDPRRRSSGNMLGANRLAIEGLPLFPTMPVGSRLATTGFQGNRSSSTYWTWPIWKSPLTIDVVRSLLAYRLIQDHTPPRDELLQIGVVEVFRSRRLTIGKVRNLTPARSVGH